MFTFSDLLQNFFTHKDFLPPADQIPGTMFTPLHFLFALCLATAVILLGLFLSKKSEKSIRTVFACIWAVLVVLEFTKITWESVSGATVRVEWGGMMPLYPCSIFMYAMPLPFGDTGSCVMRPAAMFAPSGYSAPPSTLYIPPRCLEITPVSPLQASTPSSITAACSFVRL